MFESQAANFTEHLNSKKSMNTKPELKPINECTTVAELADKSRFTKGAHARNGKGFDCDVSDPGAVCFCLVGAIAKVTGKLCGTAQYEKLRSLIGDWVVSFNDSHTYEEVYAKVIEAGI
jgi:hypothetical protein